MNANLQRIHNDLMVPLKYQLLTTFTSELMVNSSWCHKVFIVVKPKTSKFQ